MPDKECLLSVVITGRDDGYMPDFRYRLQTTLDHFSRNIELLGLADAVEIIFVDWGSEPPLAETLPVAAGTRNVVRWLHVPAATISEVLGSAGGFHNTLAFNAGLRRSQGRFVAFFPADAIVPVHALAQLVELLEGKIECPVRAEEALWFIARGHVPWQFVSTQPTIEEWDRYLWLNAWAIPIDEETAPSFFGGAAAFLLSRSLWLACGGLDESLGGYGGSDNDLGFRIGTRYPWLDLTFLGIRAYHMEHGPGGTRGESVKKGNALLYDRPFQANSDDWGLATSALPLIPQRVQLPETDLTTNRQVGGPSKSVPPKQTVWPGGWSEETERAATQAIQQTVQRLGNHFGHLPRRAHELDTLLAVACWCAEHPPRTCVDFGVRMPLALSVIATLSPAATIQGLAAQPPAVTCETAVCLQLILRHKGYVRFVFGDPATAVPRAISTSPEGNTCDFALVRCDLDAAVFATVMGQVFEALVSQGACLVAAESADLFRSRWSEAQRLLPAGHFFLVGESGCCGLVLKPDAKPESMARRCEATIRFTPRVVCGLGREMKRLYRWRKCRSRFAKLSRGLRSWLSRPA